MFNYIREVFSKIFKKKKNNDNYPMW
jgi:hypothetical protein